MFVLRLLRLSYHQFWPLGTMMVVTHLLLRRSTILGHSLPRARSKLNPFPASTSWHASLVTPSPIHHAVSDDVAVSDVLSARNDPLPPPQVAPRPEPTSSPSFSAVSPFSPLFFPFTCIQLHLYTVGTYRTFGFSLSHSLPQHNPQVCLTTGPLRESVKCSCWQFHVPI